MRLDPILDEPAIVVDGDTLVVADLHIGMEAELKKAGIFLPSQTGKMANRLVKIAEETEVDTLVILGDVKHYIPGTAALERRDLPLFFEEVLACFKEVHVAVGNHDALIKSHVPRKVRFHRPGGFAIDDVGFVHGHEWPSPSVAGCRTLLMGHNHPAIAMVDDLGARSFKPCWVRFKFRKKVKGHLVMPREGLLVPSFNELCGGVAVNDVRTRMLGPLAAPHVANFPAADIHLLDGAYLGKLRDLTVDTGLRPRDFRQ